MTTAKTSLRAPGQERLYGGWTAFPEAALRDSRVRYLARMHGRGIDCVRESGFRMTTYFVGASRAVVSLALLILAACGGGGGTTGPPPPPAITDIVPTTATRGGPAFTLTVNGSNFVTGSAVQWNGTNRTTVFVSSSQVTAQISSDDILVAGTENVSVANPAPNAATSNTLPFNIPCVLAPATQASPQTRARLGAIYFDGWAGPLTSYHLRRLVTPSYQSLQPLSGWRDDNACAVEQALAWAHSFGLNFFVFDW